MIPVSWSVFLVFLPLGSTSVLLPRPTTLCGQYDSVTSGAYTLFTNLWGEANAVSGSQCSTLDSVHGDIAAWSTKWTWTGGSNVKSFSNLQLNAGINRQLCAITSVPSKWDWSQSNHDVKADVSYDLFTSDTAGGSPVNEIMIWLANFNSGPVSYHYSSSGAAIPIATHLAIAGHAWDLYSGTNGYNKVFSFLLVHGIATSFAGDIHKFLTYLVRHGHVDASQYLTTAQAGTETTSGSATFTTCAYSMAIH